MASCVNSGVALACVPTAIAPEERAAHFALVRQLFDTLVQERAELPNGYAYRFPPDAMQLVARFIGNERRCCPFLTFELVVSADAGPVWLRMTGPQGTQVVLDAELAFPSPISG